MDRLSLMQAFCRIVERGSFARAAEDLGVSPALLSRDLKRLEQNLGCTLLARSTRRMALTDHGRVYYGEARRILADIERTEDTVRQAAGQIRGRLSVNAPHSFGITVLAQWLPAFLAMHPALELKLSLDDRVVDLIEGGFDLTIRIRATLPDSGLVARDIGGVEQALFASPAYVGRAGAPETPDDLPAHSFVNYLHADDSTTWQLQGPDGDASVRFQPRVAVGSSLILRDLLIAGQGIGSLPDFLSAPQERLGRLVRVLPRYTLPARRVYAVAVSRRGVDAKALAFIEHLRNGLARGS